MPGEFHGQRSLAGYSTWGRKSQTRLGNFKKKKKQKKTQVLAGIVLKAGDGAVNKSKRKTLPSWNLHLSNGNQEIISAASLPPGPLARECPFPGGPQ